jgi:cobalt-zinc-cadmium efflux system protein
VHDGHDDHEHGSGPPRSGDHGPGDRGHHEHGAVARRAGERHRSRLLVAFCLIGAFFGVEAVAGVLTRSLALLSDAGHMLTDVLGLGMALAAVSLATRHERRRSADGAVTHHTFGLYRLEILAAFVNALVLVGVAAYVIIEAVRRIGDDHDVDTGPMLIVAVLGLVVNLVAFSLLRSGAGESINVEGAYLEVVADTVGSVGVIIAAIAAAAGWHWVDPVIGAAIGVWVLPRTFRLGRQAVRILLQSAPPHVDLARLAGDLAALPGVVDVHDLHVWTLTSDMEAASAHLMTAEGADQHEVLDRAIEVITRQYGIEHATLQVEPHTHTGCGDVRW